jgi:hypothetical protein
VQLAKRSVLFIFSGLQVCIFLAATVKPAHAYVDPGSGLLFFQIGGSMLAGALFVMRTKLRKLFGLKPKVEVNVLDDRSETAGESPVRTGTHG